MINLADMEGEASVNRSFSYMVECFDEWKDAGYKRIAVIFVGGILDALQNYCIWL